MKKGQITIAIATISAIGLIGASIASSWVTASRRVGVVETEVAVVKTTENLHYQELIRILERIEKKVDSNNLRTK